MTPPLNIPFGLTLNISAVPPNVGLANSQFDARGRISLSASHRTTKVCEQMYTVDAVEVGTDLWQLAEGWKHPDRLLPATSLHKAGDTWLGQLSWTPRAGESGVQGLVVCIVPETLTYFPYKQLLEVDVKPLVAAVPVASAPDAHLDAIATAFHSVHQTATTFSAAVFRLPAR